ncbi:hypothetical protein C5167_031150 [Papaver somniferum]|nr:hypothetical protein C5167_031150 [Papaver somniferum]
MSLKFTSTIIIIGSPKKNLVMDFTDVSNSLKAFVKAKQNHSFLRLIGGSLHPDGSNHLLSDTLLCSIRFRPVEMATPAVSYCIMGTMLL